MWKLLKIIMQKADAHEKSTKDNFLTSQHSLHTQIKRRFYEVQTKLLYSNEHDVFLPKKQLMIFYIHTI